MRKSSRWAVAGVSALALIAACTLSIPDTGAKGNREERQQKKEQRAEKLAEEREQVAERATDPIAFPRPAPTPPAGVKPCTGGRCAATVSGKNFLRGGKKWIPKGVVLTGFLAPSGYVHGPYLRARQDIWGNQLFSDLRDAGADTVRFNVSLGGLDPQNAMPDGRMTAERRKQYVEDIKYGVAFAEAWGMNVILTITDGKPSGDPDTEHRAGPQTARAWATLAPAYVNDPAVMLIAFNEPNFGGANTIDADPRPWQEWKQSFALAVDAIRKLGAKNVIILDGISTSRVWRKNTSSNIPRDPLNQLAYDMHPFPSDDTQSHGGGGGKINYNKASDIDYWLDGWCDTRPCIASAFFAGVAKEDDAVHCYDKHSRVGRSVTDIGNEFVDYFTRKGIGVMIFAGDWPNRFFDKPGKPGAQPTNYAKFSDCANSPADAGPGATMKSTWTKIKSSEVAE